MKTHFFVDKAVQDGHEETLWRQPKPSQWSSYKIHSPIILKTWNNKQGRHILDAICTALHEPLF